MTLEAHIVVLGYVCTFFIQDFICRHQDFICRHQDFICRHQDYIVAIKILIVTINLEIRGCDLEIGQILFNSIESKKYKLYLFLLGPIQSQR